MVGGTGAMKRRELTQIEMKRIKEGTSSRREGGGEGTPLDNIVWGGWSADRAE
jgi:hypothetical protein